MERAALPVSKGGIFTLTKQEQQRFKETLGRRLILFIYKHDEHLNFTIAFSWNMILMCFSF